jgi:hypothetical protein
MAEEAEDLLCIYRKTLARILARSVSAHHPDIRRGLALSLTAIAAEARDVEAIDTGEFLVLEHVIDLIVEHLHQSIRRRLAHRLEQPVNDTHAVNELAWVIQMQVAGDPNFLTFDNST